MANFRAFWPKEDVEEVVEDRDDDWEVLSEDSCELEGFVLPEKLMTKWRNGHAPSAASSIDAVSSSSSSSIAISTATSNGPSSPEGGSKEQSITLNEVGSVNKVHWGNLKRDSVEQGQNDYDGVEDSEIEYEDEEGGIDNDIAEAEQDGSASANCNKANSATSDDGLIQAQELATLVSSSSGNSDELVIKTPYSAYLVEGLFSRGVQSPELQDGNKLPANQSLEARTGATEGDDKMTIARESNSGTFIALDIANDNRAADPGRSDGPGTTCQTTNNERCFVYPSPQGNNAYHLGKYFSIQLSSSLFSINCRLQFAAAVGLLVSCVVIFNNTAQPPSLRRVERSSSSSKGEGKVLVIDDVALKALATVTTTKALIPTYGTKRVLEEHEEINGKWKPLTIPSILTSSPPPQVHTLVNVPAIAIGSSIQQSEVQFKIETPESMVSFIRDTSSYRESALVNMRGPASRDPLDALMHASLEAFENLTIVALKLEDSIPVPFSDDNSSKAMIEELDWNMGYQPALPPSLEEGIPLDQDGINDSGPLMEPKTPYFPLVDYPSGAVAKIYTEVSMGFLNPPYPFPSTILPPECHECVLATLLGGIASTHEQACESCQLTSREYAALGRSMAYTSNLHRNLKIHPEKSLSYTRT